MSDKPASDQSVIDKGFTQLGAEVGSLTTRRNLTVTVSSLYNNTEIFCRAFAQGSSMHTDSEIAILIVQGIHAYKSYKIHVVALWE